MKKTTKKTKAERRMILVDALRIIGPGLIEAGLGRTTFKRLAKRLIP